MQTEFCSGSAVCEVAPNCQSFVHVSIRFFSQKVSCYVPLLTTELVSLSFAAHKAALRTKSVCFLTALDTRAQVAPVVVPQAVHLIGAAAAELRLKLGTSLWKVSLTRWHQWGSRAARSVNLRPSAKSITFYNFWSQCLGGGWSEHHAVDRKFRHCLLQALTLFRLTRPVSFDPSTCMSVQTGVVPF